MKKYLSIILCIALITTIAAVPALAAGTVTETMVGSNFEDDEKIYALEDGSDIIDYSSTGDGTLDEAESGKVKAVGTYEIAGDSANKYLKLTSPDSGKSAVAFTNNFGNKFGKTFLEFDLMIGKPLTGDILQIISTRVAGNQLDNSNKHMILASKTHETSPETKGVLILKNSAYASSEEIYEYEYELNKWYHFKMTFYDYPGVSKNFRYNLDITPQGETTNEIRFTDTDHKNWITWGTGHKLHNAVIGLAAGTNSELYIDNFNVRKSYTQAEVTSAAVADGKIAVTFDKNMNADSFTDNVELYAGNENKSIAFSGALTDNVYTITPTGTFKAGYNYTLKLKNGIKCVDGGNLKDADSDETLLYAKTFSMPMGDVKLVSCDFSESTATITNGLTATVKLENDTLAPRKVYGALALYNDCALINSDLKEITVSAEAVGATAQDASFSVSGAGNGAAFYLLDENLMPLCDEAILSGSVLAKENTGVKSDTALKAVYSTVDGSVTVSGKASAYDVVTIATALTTDVTTEVEGIKSFDAAKLKTVIQTANKLSAIGQVMADKDGYFELCFTKDVNRFNTDNYTAAALTTSGGTTPLTTSFDYTNPIQLERELGKINSETDPEDMMDLIDTNKGIFELEMTDYIDSVKTGVGTLLINERPQNGYENPAALEVVLDKAIAVARAKDKTVALSMIKKYFGENVFGEGDAEIPTEEQQYTANLVGGVGYTTFKAFEDAFSDAQIICEASFLETTGEAKSLIENTEKAAVIKPFELEEISTKYSAINEKKNVFDLMLNKDYTTIIEINDTFEAAVRSIYNQENPPVTQTPSYDGGGGGGGGGGSISKKDVENMKPKEETVQKVVFSDIDSAAWAAESILGLHAMGVIDGDGNGNFRPDDTIKREELIKILVNAFEIGDDTASCDFDDIPKDHWSYKYVSSAYKYGLVQGMGGNSFGSGIRMSRQDLMTLVYRLALKKGMVSPENEKPYLYDDYYEISDYARKAVSYISNEGLNFNIKDNKFQPKNDITRAEAAATVWGFLEAIKE